MVTADSSESCSGWNGYASGRQSDTRLSSSEKIFLTRNSEAERWMLLMTRRPSSTTAGNAAKSESSSTSCATWLAACAPDAMAMPQSASLRASTSLTPSPVMATVCPCCCNTWMSLRFCSGVTRPNTAQRCAACASSASLCSAAASAQRSAPAMPACAATWLTARGSSPEMTLTVTPCPAK